MTIVPEPEPGTFSPTSATTDGMFFFTIAFTFVSTLFISATVNANAVCAAKNTNAKIGRRKRRGVVMRL